MQTTREDVENWRDSIIYHGPSKEWVDLSLAKHGKVKSYDFEGEPTNSQHLSVAFEPDEALAYAIKHSHRYNVDGTVLLIPFTGKVLDRFVPQEWDYSDAPMPYFLAGEFEHHIIDRVPADIAQLFDKDIEDLDTLQGDLDVSSLSIPDLVRGLERYCAKQVGNIERSVRELYPLETFFDEDTGIGVIKVMQDNGLVDRKLLEEFGYGL